MPRHNVNELVAFIAVARESSFTRAAAKFGISQSALSHTIRNLETRLGMRLLMRTTRAVSPTEAGERLLEGIGPLLDEVDAQVDALAALRDKPAGSIRIAASEYVITYILWPSLREVLREYPDIKVELHLDNGLTDIVTERFDAGVRFGENLANDMISVRLSADSRMVVVGAPSYFETRERPTHPTQLLGHDCVNFRLPSSGGLYAWEFADGDREFKVRVEGSLTFNHGFNTLQAAIDGFGLCYIPEEMAAAAVGEGRLISVLDEFCPPWDGYYLYYPNRRQSSRAFMVVVEALRYRAPPKTA